MMRRDLPRRLRALTLVLSLTAFAGCANVVSKPSQPRLFDLGALPPAAAAPAARSAPPLVLPALEASGALDGSALLYRLGYSAPDQLRPYTQSRWSAPAAELVHDRLAALLARERTVLGSGQLTATASGKPPQVLRIELQEFSQDFVAPERSEGRLRIRATLLQSGPQGDRLIAQRSFSVQRPAPTPDAAGGVRALSEAVDAAAGELAQWLRSAGASAGLGGLHSG